MFMLMLCSPDGALDMSVELPAHKLHALTSLLDVSASYLGADIRYVTQPEHLEACVTCEIGL